MSGPTYVHLATSEMSRWSAGRGILAELSLCYSIVYYYDGGQRYEQFLQVKLSYLPSASVSSVFMVLYMFNFFVTFCTLSFGELSLVGLALDLVDRSSVL